MHQILYTLASGTTDIEGQINAFSLRTIGVASLVLVVLLVIASFVVKNKKLHHIKTPLFVLIAATIILPSLLLTGSTVYVNTISESKGPVHWHTDIEFWVCGQEVELRNPTGFLSNKIGTATYHEHDDKRIHLEGVVVEKAYDASLEKFMDVTGGSIDPTSIIIPVEEVLVEDETDGDQPRGDIGDVRQYLETVEDDMYTLNLQNGDTCGGQPAELQVFVLSFNEDSNTYSQEKLVDPRRYIMRDESIVPPGDCLIVEFDTSKSATDRLCQQFGVRDTERCTEFGVTAFNPELCNIQQATNDDTYESYYDDMFYDETKFNDEEIIVEEIGSELEETETNTESEEVQ